MSQIVYFSLVHGQPMQGVLTGRDYEEIEVTTADGEKYYISDEWLDQKEPLKEYNY